MSAAYLPEGAVAVGAGLAVAGLTTYGFLIASARALGAGPYASLSALWSLVLIGGPGILFPVEQEVSRTVAARRARGAGGGPVVLRAAALGGSLVALLALVILVANGFLVDHLFSGHGLLAVALAVALPAYLGQHLARGVLSATGRFRTYGVLLAAEGAIRLAGGLLLAGAGVDEPGPFGMLIGLAPLLALPVAWGTAATVRGRGPQAPWAELSQALGYLLAGSVLGQTLVNVGPVAVKVLTAESEQAAAGRFLASLVVVRVPLFFFGAVVVALLPKLAQLAAVGRMREFNGAFSRLLVGVVAVAVASTVAAAAIGPVAVRVLFGPGFSLDRSDLTVLAASSGAFMIALTLAQGLVALLGHREAMLGWLAGVVAFTAVSLVGSDVIGRIERALLLGSLAAAATLASLLHRRVQAGRMPGGEPAVALHPSQLEP